MLGALPGLLLCAWAGVAFWVGSNGWGTLFALGALGLLVAAVFSLRPALERRASDIVIEETGFSVDGGPHHGLQVPWSALAQGKLELKTDSETSSRLVLYLPKAGSRVLARTDDPAERSSLVSLARALRE